MGHPSDQNEHRPEARGRAAQAGSRSLRTQSGTRCPPTPPPKSSQPVQEQEGEEEEEDDDDVMDVEQEM